MTDGRRLGKVGGRVGGGVGHHLLQSVRSLQRGCMWVVGRSDLHGSESLTQDLKQLDP